MENSFFTGVIQSVTPRCYDTYSDNPFTHWMTFGFSGPFPRRGFFLMMIAVAEGVLIGVVYIELFVYVAEILAEFSNQVYWHDHLTTIVNFTYV